MLIEFIAAPTMDDKKPAEAEALGIAEEIMARIAEIKGDPPFYLDVSERSKWLQLVDSTLADLQSLVDRSLFKETTSETVRILDRYARDPSVLDAVERNVGLIHGDLNGGNIFVTDGGYKLIDWQRPAFGPRDLNLVQFLVSFGFDAAKHAPPGLLGIHYFLGVRWLTECKKTWIPDAVSYDKWIAGSARRMKDLLG